VNSKPIYDANVTALPQLHMRYQ